STARDFFASESARSFCWRVMAVFASLMSSRAAKAESAHKAGQAVARDIRIIDADFIRHLPWQANNQLRADFITNLAQWRIARRAARQALEAVRVESARQGAFCSEFPPNIALTSLGAARIGALLRMGAGLAGNCGPGAFTQQKRGIIRRQRTRGRARTAPIEALEGLLNLPAINHECSAGSEHRSQTRK